MTTTDAEIADPDRVEKLCAQKGLKMTEQRRVIARVLSESHDHPDVEALYQRATVIDPRISIATVYRTVRLFEEAGILTRHDFGDGRARYEEVQGEHHDHLIDIESGAVIEFQNEQIEKLKQHQQEAQEQLEQFRKASEDAWEDMRTGMETAWTAFGEAMKTAASRFK